MTMVISKNWQDLIKPNKLEVQMGDDPKRIAVVVAEPLERGFGLTMGNALRRILTVVAPGGGRHGCPHRRSASRVLLDSRRA